MKKTILYLILIAFFFCAISNTWAATPDYTALDPGTSYNDLAVCAQANAGIMQLNQKIDTVQQSANQCFKTSEIDKLKESLNQQFSQQTNEMMGKILTMLIAFAIAFYSFLFISKAKRWF